ncbi:amino acid ABC transporter ATP-binding protein [Halotalea alkalilenta]|uniref:Amino acid ABC transporter ATP-binding protein n=1 Tax=Halotalea alkalilenta TaxID=376489 RepID=A0A172YFG5_9GAMM|nr:amino acid ABC transporter ATP-binding protein [Halotalea alkalilenta]ANF58009.1 amino acid ABC transporter ATP-binding protein [Halotalea alkalilenta]
MSMVRVDALYKSFGANQVLKGIDLRIQEGEVVSIIGRSGSGKSTLLRCLNQLELHDSGSIEINGKRLDGEAMSARQLSEHVGMIFQSFNLFPHRRVGENVMLAPMVVRGESREAVEPRARALLESVGLGEKFDAWPGQLSGGQQQRVAIARALAMAPKVLLCDEITSALDPELVGEVLRVLEKLAVDGMTLVLVTHEMRFAREVGSRVVFMHQGKIHEQGDAKRVLDDPQTPELKQFLASTR